MKEEYIEEKTIYVTFIKYQTKNYDTKIQVTDQNIYFLKKGGLFRREYKEFESIPINDIVKYKNKVHITTDEETIFLETMSKDYIFSCETAKEAKTLRNKIVEASIGDDKFDVFTKRTKAIVSITEKLAVTALAITGTFASIASGVKKILKK